MTEKPNPNRNTMVEDADISQDSITTQVILRENAVSEVRLRANNENGANYLKTLHLKDEVVVKMVPDSNPPTAINWTTDPTMVKVFDGNVEELSPLLNTSQGQVVEVVAFGKGFGCGQMRVSDTYRNYVPYPNIKYVNNFYTPQTFGNWTAWYVFGLARVNDNVNKLATPWVGNEFVTGGYKNAQSSYVSIPVTTLNEGSLITSFKFLNIGEGFEGAVLSKAELHIVGGMVSPSSIWATSVTIKAEYSIDNGATWYDFASPSTFTPFTNSFNPYITLFYDPLTDYPNLPFNGGVDNYINMLAGSDPNLLDYHNDLMIRFSMSGYTGTAQGEVGIIMCYLNLLFVQSDGNTVRQLIAGPTNKATDGIVSDFINNVYPLGIPSGYSINTDYVVKEALDDAHLIPYIKFPYQDGLTCLQDIIKQGSALQFNQGGVGYHFIFDVNGNLLLAPITNHHVSGADPTKYIDTDGGWNLTPYLTPLVVREDMITQKFTQQMPLANYVLIAGRFTSPFDDLWCEQNATISVYTPSWRVYKNSDWGVNRSDLVSFDNSTDNTRVGSGSIKFNCEANSSIDCIIGLNDFPTDFTKLMGDSTTAEIKFFIKLGSNISSGTLALRLYQDQYNYFSTPINTSLVNQWTDEKSEKVPNIVWNPAEIGKWTKTGNPTLTNINFIGVYYAASLVLDANLWLDGLHIEANIVRGATDSTSISGPITISGKLYSNGIGCRTLTIKDSVANTDRIDDVTALPTTPLALEAFYELSRHRIARMTGQIKIPLNPVWQAGQVAFINAECNIPKGAIVTIANLIPTTSTAGILLQYFVDSGHLLEVYQLTSITSGPVYHWTDLNVKRYGVVGAFRITEVMHEFTTGMAATTLTLTNDFVNSCPLDTKGSYSVLIRTIIPDFQNKTMGSLKSGGDFNLGLRPIIRDYPS
jgi:hypothetical protein